MQLIEAVQTVKGAVSEKGLVEVMTHVHVGEERVTATNGVVTLSAKCKGEHDSGYCVNAKLFQKALDNAGAGAEVKVDGNDVHIRSATTTFKAKMPVLPNDHFPFDLSSIPKRLNKVEDPSERLAALEPFMGEDASRVWATGVLFNGSHLCATNNVSIVRSKYTIDCDPFILPRDAVKELMRLQPTKFKQEKTRVVFANEKVTLISLLVAGEWPDIDRFFGADFSEVSELDPDLLQQVRNLIPFCESKNMPIVYFSEGKLHNNAGTGYKSDIDECAFDANVLGDVLEIAEKIDWSAYPKPCGFFGDLVEGCLLGVTQ